MSGDWVVHNGSFSWEVAIISILSEPQALVTFSLPKRKQNYEWMFTSIVPPSLTDK